MRPKHLLKNQHIIITGINGLLGQSIAEYCISAGGSVTGIDLTNNTSNKYNFIQADVTNIAEISTVISKFKSHPPQGWVNAAYPRTEDWGKNESYSESSWEKNIHMQLTSSCQIIEKVGEIMKPVTYGSIVSLASIYGILGPQFDIYQETNMTMPAPYAAIKGGLINFSKYMAAKLGQSKIRVNCISPGGIEDNQSQIFIDNYSKRTMLNRMGTPEDIAAPTAFLLSDQSTYITGQNLLVDGGWSAM